MVNLEKLRARIDNSGMTMVAVAKQTGITRETLYNRLSSKGEFTASEIAALTDVLKLTKKERDEIFFAKYVN